MGRKELSAVLTGVRTFEVREFDIPEIGDNDALLKVEMAGVCSSDVHRYNGGKVAFPIILGHEILGRIDEIGSSAMERFKVKKGDRVVVGSGIPCGACSYCLTGNYKYCQNPWRYGTGLTTDVPPSLWGGYSQYMYLHPNSVFHKISDDVPAEAAVLAKAVIGNGIQWLRVMGEAKIGDTVVIQGTGPQGLSATIAARESGAGNIIVTGLTRDAQRLALAREYGANHTVNVEEEDVVKFVRELTGGKMADVILDVTGNTRGMVTSVDLVKKQGIVVCAGTGTKSPTPLMMDKIVLNEIRLQGVFSSDSKVTPAAVKLIESRKYPIEKMVTHKFTLHQADEAVRAVAGEIEGMYPIKAVLVP